MAADWSPLTRELAQWRAEGRDLPVWWRDDDARMATPALDRLVTLSARLDLPLHLAVVPEDAGPSLRDVARLPHVIPLVHGWAHRNHAPAGEKKSEFPQDRAEAYGEAVAARDRLAALFGDDLLPVFVPPWNRIGDDLVPRLAGLGYAGLSTFTPRRDRLAAPGLVRINTHLDPIDWRGGGGLLAEDALTALLVGLLQDRRHGRTDATEPLGLLTHHLVHDAAIWSFVERVSGRLLDGGARPVNLWELREALP